MSPTDLLAIVAIGLSLASVFVTLRGLPSSTLRRVDRIEELAREAAGLVHQVDADWQAEKHAVRKIVNDLEEEYDRADKKLRAANARERRRQQREGEEPNGEAVHPLSLPVGHPLRRAYISQAAQSGNDD